MLKDNPLMATIPASDLDRAKEFYSNVLGLTPSEEPDQGAAWYEVGGSRFLLYQSAFAGTNQATAASWMVDGLESIVDTLKGQGVEFQEFEIEGLTMENSIVTAPDGNRAAWFFDSERNIINLTETPAS